MSLHAAPTRSERLIRAAWNITHRALGWTAPGFTFLIGMAIGMFLVMAILSDPNRLTP